MYVVLKTLRTTSSSRSVFHVHQALTTSEKTHGYFILLLRALDQRNYVYYRKSPLRTIYITKRSLMREHNVDTNPDVQAFPSGLLTIYIIKRSLSDTWTPTQTCRHFLLALQVRGVHACLALGELAGVSEVRGRVYAWVWASSPEFLDHGDLP